MRRCLTSSYSVGLGSDYDGIPEGPVGLEDVSKYPDLVRSVDMNPKKCASDVSTQVAELYTRGWNAFELAGLTGANLLRVMEGAERVAWELQRSGAQPSMARYDKRTDL